MSKSITLHPEYRPLPAQKLFHNLSPNPIEAGIKANPIKYRAYIGGVGSGKSMANVIEALRWLGHYPGCAGMIVSPTLTQLKKSILVEFLTQCELSKGFLLNYNKSEFRAEFVNGSTLYFGNAMEPDSLRGPNLTFFGFDEAGQINDDGEAFRILQGRIRDPKFPVTGGWITTTPRGKNWLYDYFELKQTPDGVSLIDADDYTIINCKTEDNTYLDASFAASLRQSYSGQFARQELDGSFISFDGLVYPNLSSQVGTIAPGLLQRVVAGLDWGFTHPSSVIIVGQDKDGKLHVLAEAVETQTPIETSDGSKSWVQIIKELKEKWKFEVIYCDPSSPATISSLQRHNLRAVQADNAVLAGISAVTAAQNNGMLISPDCVHLLKELDSYEWEKSREGKIKQDSVKKINDDACFIAGTMITTSTGNKPIEKISIGDMVLTRNGYRKVLNAGISGYVNTTAKLSLSGGKTLIATPNHKIWADEWIPMNSLRYNCIINTVQVKENKLCSLDHIETVKQKLLNTKVSNLGDILKVIQHLHEIITDHILQIDSQGLIAYTGKSGKTSMEKFQRDTIFTILETGLIIDQKISSVCHNSNISVCMEIILQKNRELLEKIDWILLENSQKSGIVQKQVLSGIKNMEQKFLQIENLLVELVKYAKKNTLHSSMPIVDFAQTTVNPNIEEIVEWITKSGFVEFVGNNLLSVNIDAISIVQENVVGYQEENRLNPVPVYNLTVDIDHEYFANGILVKNCDALRYAVISFTTQAQQPVRFKPIQMKRNNSL